jgi:hypothetical protein
MLMTTGRITLHQAVDRVVLAMAITPTTGEGEEGRQGCCKQTRTGSRTNNGKVTENGDAKGKAKAIDERKRQGKRNSKGKVITQQTPGGDDISCTITLQLQMERYKEYSDTEG